WPKMTGRMLNETLGKVTFWLLFLGFNMTFLIQHWIGVSGMPRRYWSYLESDGVTWMNGLSSIGSALMAVAMIPFLLNLWITWRRA
ncbi:cbb3-type cytochrome c oxidase subunit I, partial [Pseudomonas aeruginosa]